MGVTVFVKLSLFMKKKIVLRHLSWRIAFEIFSNCFGVFVSISIHLCFHLMLKSFSLFSPSVAPCSQQK